VLRWLCDSPRTGCAWRTTPYIYVARTSNNRVIPVEWSWWVPFDDACEPGEQLIVLANGDDKSDRGVEALPILTCEPLNVTTSVRGEWSWHVNSVVACCHSAKLCAHAARDFRSQHLSDRNGMSVVHICTISLERGKQRDCEVCRINSLWKESQG